MHREENIAHLPGSTKKVNNVCLPAIDERGNECHCRLKCSSRERVLGADRHVFACFKLKLNVAKLLPCLE
jgi:hypothetical protein